MTDSLEFEAIAMRSTRKVLNHLLIGRTYWSHGQRIEFLKLGGGVSKDREARGKVLISRAPRPNAQVDQSLRQRNNKQTLTNRAIGAERERGNSSFTCTLRDVISIKQDN